MWGRHRHESHPSSPPSLPAERAERHKTRGPFQFDLSSPHAPIHSSSFSREEEAVSERRGRLRRRRARSLVYTRPGERASKCQDSLRNIQ